MPATLGIICFRRRFEDTDSESEVAARNASLIASLAESGVGMVSTTRLHGRFAIRLCALNHTSTASDVRRVLEHLASAEPTGAAPQHTFDAERVPVRAPQPATAGADDLWAHPLLAGLSAEGRAAVAGRGTEVRVPSGEVVVARWAADRDFYLVLDGELVVDVDGTEANRLRPGDFFGELAARDWGSGFGYPRLATVTARRPARLWRLPPEVFGTLVATEPSVRAPVEEAVRHRLVVT